MYWPTTGVPPVVCTLAVTVWSVPIGPMESSGAIVTAADVTSIDDPAMRTYASPHALSPVAGSIPRVGCDVVSVATASALQSDVNVGKDSCTEQPQPCSEAVVRSANAAFDAISETLPSHGGNGSMVQIPDPALDRGYQRQHVGRLAVTRRVEVHAGAAHLGCGEGDAFTNHGTSRPERREVCEVVKHGIDSYDHSVACGGSPAGRAENDRAERRRA